MIATARQFDRNIVTPLSRNPDIETEAIRGARDDSFGNEKRLPRVEAFAMCIVTVAREKFH